MSFLLLFVLQRNWYTYDHHLNSFWKWPMKLQRHQKHHHESLSWVRWTWIQGRNAIIDCKIIGQHMTRQIKIEVANKFIFQHLGRMDEYIFHLGGKGALDVFVLCVVVPLTIFSDLSCTFVEAFQGDWKARKEDGKKTFAKETSKEWLERKLSYFFQIYHYYARIIAWKFSLHSQRLH